MNNIFLIVSREYSTRVKKKGFIFTTLLMPLVMVAMMFAPVLIANLTSPTISTITVIDQSSDSLGLKLLQSGSLPYVLSTDQISEAIADESNSKVLVIGENALSDPTDFVLFNRDGSSLDIEMLLRDDLKNIIETERLKAYNIDDLPAILEEISAKVIISTRTVSQNGEESSSDTLTSFLIGIAMAFILYMFILIYGQLVMMSIIEEKNNRVLEIIVTSVKPFQLMFGKILGIGAVAVTQVLIWGAIIGILIQFGLPVIAGESFYSDLQAFQSGSLDLASSTADLSLLQAMSLLGNIGYIFTIFGYMLLFMIGGFLLYASIYAAIGASVDNAQDASQLQIFAMVPVLLGLVFAMTASQNPDASVSVWLSMIPLTSPMVMMARIPSGVPFHEVLISLGLLYALIVFMIWFAAKIYRIGIFMYGKKPTIGELIKWTRYK